MVLSLAIAALVTVNAEAVVAAQAPQGTRVQVLSAVPPSQCPGTIDRVAPFETSGRVPAHFSTARCQGWGWVNVRVLELVAVTTRSVPSGDVLDGAWSMREVERRAGHDALREVPKGARATRTLSANTTVEATQLQVGPPTGTAVTVRIVIGGLSVEQRGTIISCRSSTCATLPSGKRVSGTYEGGVITVVALGEAP